MKNVQSIEAVNIAVDIVIRKLLSKNTMRNVVKTFNAIFFVAASEECHHYAIYLISKYLQKGTHYFVLVCVFLSNRYVLP